jgi:hypothetical protein
MAKYERIKWTKELEVKIRENFPNYSDRQIENYKLGCELLYEVLKDIEEHNKNHGK